MKFKTLKLCTVVLLFSFVVAGCKKDTSINICGVNDPLMAINWLKELKFDIEQNNEVSSAEIILYKWNNKDYIYLQKRVDSSYDLPSTIYDCEGNDIYHCGGNQPNNNCSIFFSEAQKIKSLWKKE